MLFPVASTHFILFLSNSPGYWWMDMFMHQQDDRHTQLPTDVLSHFLHKISISIFTGSFKLSNKYYLSFSIFLSCHTYNHFINFLFVSDFNKHLKFSSNKIFLIAFFWHIIEIWYYLVICDFYFYWIIEIPFCYIYSSFFNSKVIWGHKDFFE
jgi:hypothetical protein